MPIARRRVRTTAVVSTAVISLLMLVLAACTGAGPQTSSAGKQTSGARVPAPGGSPAVAYKGIWHTALEIPGTAALNEGGNAQGVSISCPSAGNCTATGGYYDASGAEQPFVVSEVNGGWRSATQLPGIAALGTGALIWSVSCASAGNCGAGGSFTFGSQRAFVVSEVNGTWSPVVMVPGMAALGDGKAQVNSVSCASAGNCSAGGEFTDTTGAQQAFVVDEVNGHWQDAIEVPGTLMLNTGRTAWVSSVSCAAPGNCIAGGSYLQNGLGQQAFTASEVNGAWHTAELVPGSAKLNKGGGGVITSVACTAPGNCGAGGSYNDAAGASQALVVTQVNGVWRSAIEVPGSQALNKGGNATVNKVSCPSAGNCTAVGAFAVGPFPRQQAFVVREVNGTWGTAVVLPGTEALNEGVSATAKSVSCASPVSCVAAGTYTDRSGHTQAFVAAEMNGTWRKAIEAPGGAALNRGGSTPDAADVSCGAAGNCSVVSGYTDASRHHQAFVISAS
jgi:hypothetical protein